MYLNSEFTAIERIPDAIIVDALRCWDVAREKGLPVQPKLYSLLGPAGYDMLAPVFDSLLRLCESWLDHDACSGCPLAAGDRERFLCLLLDDPTLVDRIGPCRASEGISRTLTCALLSVRFLAGRSGSGTAIRLADVYQA